MSDVSPSPEDLSFEEALERLESIVQQLEQGDFTLDESISSYEEGVKLAQMCIDRLKSAEMRIQSLHLDDDE